MFVVMGVTGQVGRAVANTLIDGGREVRVIVRSESKARQWTARDAEFAVAAIENPESMVEALAGVEGAFVMLPPIFDPSPGFPEAKAMITALRTALTRAALPKVVVLSTIGAAAPQPNLLNQLGLMEAAFADLPMPVAFLRAAWFMENAAGDVAAARETGVITSFLQPPDKAFPMVATDDVGRVAGEILLENWGGHRIVEVEGPTRVSPNDLAAAFSMALERTVSIKVAPRDVWETTFRAQGVTNPTPRAQMVDGFNEGWIEFGNGGANARRGRISLNEAIGDLVAKTRAAAQTSED
jgi:NAD(P)H dehydrogenase (quinone)